MPYKDKEKQRAYQKFWVQERKRQWIAENGPCKQCSSILNLEVDHIDPTVKNTHRIWSLSKAKREIELAKCQVLCEDCHQKKTSEQFRRKPDELGRYQCSRCEAWKYPTEMNTRKTLWCGFDSECKACHNARMRTRNRKKKKIMTLPQAA